MSFMKVCRDSAGVGRGGSKGKKREGREGREGGERRGARYTF